MICLGYTFGNRNIVSNESTFKSYEIILPNFSKNVCTNWQSYFIWIYDLNKHSYILDFEKLPNFTVVRVLKTKDLPFLKTGGCLGVGGESLPSVISLLESSKQTGPTPQQKPKISSRTAAWVIKTQTLEPSSTAFPEHSQELGRKQSSWNLNEAL